MREKSISVRFAAVGGQAIKAELRDIGASGKQAMSGIVAGTGPASDRLEQMALAAAQARAQLEALAAKSTATAAQMRTTSLSPTPMQERVNLATGVTPQGGMSAAEMLQQGQALDDLRAKFNPVYAAIRQYRSEVAEIRDANLQGAMSSAEMAAAIDKVRTQALATIDKIKGTSAALREKAAASAAAEKAARDAAAADAQAAARLDDLRAKLNPTYGAIRQYRTEVASIREAHVAGAISADEMAAAIGKVRTQALATIDRIKGTSVALKEKAQAAKDAAAADAQQAQRLDDLRAKLNPVYGAIRQYRTEVASIREAHASGAISASEMAAAIGKVRTSTLAAIDRIKGMSAALREQEAAAKAAAAATQKEADAKDALRAKYNPVFGVIQRYKAEVASVRAAHASGALSADEMTAAINRLRTASLGQIAVLKGQTEEIEQMSRSARGGTLRMQQMFFQVNDIGVSLAGGMNPFVVMAQQGTQIAQIYGFGNGGVGGIFKDLGGLITGLPGPLKAVAAGAGLGLAAIVGMRNEIRESTGVLVSFGDVGAAVFQVLGRRIAGVFAPEIEAIGDFFEDMWDRTVRATKQTGNDIIHLAQLMRAGVGVAIDTVPDMFNKAFLSALGYVQTHVGLMLFSIKDMLDQVAAGFNAVFNTNLQGPAWLNQAGADVMNKGTANKKAARTMGGASFGDEFRKRAGEIMGTDPMGEFFDDVSDQSVENWRKRQKDEKGGKKGGGKDKAEKDEVGDLIKKLQEELAVLRETDPVKKRLLGYSEEMSKATAEERKQIEGLVRSLDRAENGFEAMGRALAEYAEESSRTGDDWGASFVGVFENAGDAFAAMVTRNEANWRDMVNSMAADWAKLAFQEHIGGPLAKLASGWLGSAIGGGADPLASALQGAGLNAIPSFEGGGWTGNGARTGGLDGKGGFLAMVHSQERIEDTTRTGRKAGGGGGGSSHVSVGVDPRNGNIQAYVDDRINATLPGAFAAFSAQALPYAIQDYMDDPRGRG